MTEQLTALREQLDRGLNEFSSGQTNNTRSKKSFIPIILMITIIVLLVLQTNVVHMQHPVHNEDPLFQLF